MITASGQQVWPNGTRYPQGGAPTIADIAQGLGRMVRFAGQTPIYYTVLCHTLVVADLVDEEYRAFALLHDAPESMIADVPSPWKDDARRALEEQLMERISRTHGLQWPWPEEAANAVRVADLAAMVAEARVLGLAELSQDHVNYWHSFPMGDLEHDAVQLTQRQVLSSNPVKFLDPEHSVPVFMGALER